MMYRFMTTFYVIQSLSIALGGICFAIKVFGCNKTEFTTVSLFDVFPFQGIAFFRTYSSGPKSKSLRLI